MLLKNTLLYNNIYLFSQKLLITIIALGLNLGEYKVDLALLAAVSSCLCLIVSISFVN